MQYQFIFDLGPGNRKAGFANSDDNVSPEAEQSAYAPHNAHVISAHILERCVRAAFNDMMHRLGGLPHEYKPAPTSGVDVKFIRIPEGAIPFAHSRISPAKLNELTASYLSGSSGTAMFEISVKTPGGSWIKVSPDPIMVSWNILYWGHLQQMMMVSQ